MLRFPDQHFSVACLCNVGNANPEKRAEKAAEVYLGAIMQPAHVAQSGEKGVTLTPEQMAALSGMYRDPDKRNVARISVANGNLQLEIYGGKFGLRALSATQLVLADLPADITLTFELAQ